MLGSVYAKSLRDRWTSVVGAGVGIGLLLWMAMAVYAEIDTSFYYELPAAFLEAVGISAEVGGIGGIAYGAMYNLMGAMTLAGVAISFGASAIAGEERAGTLGLLLANPRSRTDVTVSKLASMATLLAGGGLIYLGAALLVPAVLGVDITGIHVAALMLHLTVNALVWGMVAFAIGGWTGNRGAAVGVAAGTMVASWLATSFLPLIEGLADVARVFPWYWFNGSQPELNGVGWGHLGLQVTATLGACLARATEATPAEHAATGAATALVEDRPQQVAEVLGATAPATGHATAHEPAGAEPTEFVVLLARLLVADDGVGLSVLLEALFRRRVVGVGVRVVLAGEAAVGLLDLRSRGVPVHTEHGVVVLLEPFTLWGHGSPPPGWSGGSPVGWGHCSTTTMAARSTRPPSS